MPTEVGYLWDTYDPKAPYYLSRSDEARLDTAWNAGYLDVTTAPYSVTRAGALCGAWHARCKREKRPYLVIERRRTPRVYINLETSPCEPHTMLTAEGCRQIRALLADAAIPRAMASRAKSMQGKTGVNYELWVLDVHGGDGPPCPGKSIWCERIASERATDTARAILAVLRAEMIPVPDRWQSHPELTARAHGDGPIDLQKEGV